MAAGVLDRARERLAALRRGVALTLDVRQAAMVLQALQFDLRPEDHAVARDLVLVLVVDAEADGGFDESLRRGTYLLARFRDAGDIPILWRAKSANFDTQSGLNAQVLYACGLEPARAWVQEHRPRIDRAALLAEYLEGCGEPLEPFWAAMAAQFPEREPVWTDEALLDLERWYGEDTSPEHAPDR